MNVLDHGFVELINKTGHMGLQTVNAARCSFGTASESMEERDRRLIAYLLTHGHTSPFRHAFFTFHIKAPLFVFRQWWKYQVGSTWREYERPDGEPLFNMPIVRPNVVVASDIQIDTDQGCSWNELSGRYKVMEPEFYMPDKARRNTGKQASEDIDDELLTSEMRCEMDTVNTNALRSYEYMLECGIAKELARLVLPPSIYSEAIWTVSLQAVLHFLDQRLKEDAQFEIREYAEGVLELIKPDLKEMGIDA